jgi:uncharacterized protein (TIGR02118 family)
MHRLIVLYGHPEDAAAFDRHYETVHVPLAEKIPGMRSCTLGRPASLDGSQPPYHLVAQLTFDSLEDLQAGMGSPEGQAAAGDVPNFASGGATLFVQEDRVVGG